MSSAKSMRPSGNIHRPKTGRMARHPPMISRTPAGMRAQREGLPEPPGDRLHPGSAGGEGAAPAVAQGRHRRNHRKRSWRAGASARDRQPGHGPQSVVFPMPRPVERPSGALDRLCRSVECVDDSLDLLRAGVAAAQAQLKRGTQIEHCSLDRDDIREARVATAEAGEDGVDLGLVVGENFPALRGQPVELAPLWILARLRVAHLFKHGHRRIDDARAGRIVAPDPLAELLDDLVAVAGLLGDERENHEPQLAAVEHAALAAADVAAARTPAAERPASEAMVAGAAVAVVYIIVKMTMEHC